MMEARFRSWRQKIKTHPVVAVMITAEFGLIGDHPTIDLNRADLSGVQLYKPWLNEVNLRETNLSEADLYEADGAN
jgi:uncharacterized protein YjbI with pentapeptide repeats